MALALLAASPAGAWASGAPKVSGYVKNLFHYSHSPLDDRPYWNDLTRARLGLEGELPAAPAAAWRLRARFDYDHELRGGTFFRTRDYRLFGLAEPEGFLDMEQVLSTGTDVHYRHLLYRAWAELEADRWRLRLGRQRVAWGTGKLWNPTDILNPYVPTSIEREERRGVDAAYLRRGLGELGQAELVYTLASDWTGSDLLARARGNAGGADFSLLGGKTAPSTGSWLVGGDFSADLLGGNLHGELAHFEPGDRTGLWRGLIGYEYEFAGEAFPWAKTLWLLAEFYHNGGGELNSARYNPLRLLGGREVALARDYAGLGLRKELHPLWDIEAYHIRNLDDGSFFLAPSLAFNPWGSLHLTAGWQRFAGPKRSEFGRLHDVAFLQGQYFF